jgi:hypothetical protein
MVYLSSLKKPAQSKHSPYRRKFAQSGHPVAKPICAAMHLGIIQIRKLFFAEILRFLYLFKPISNSNLFIPRPFFNWMWRFFSIAELMSGC